MITAFVQQNSTAPEMVITSFTDTSYTASSIPLVIVIEGPTASGKTALAHALADVYPIEIISADSRQVWQELDIGTAKPTPSERQRYRYHGLDLCPPDRQMSAGEFARAAWEWIKDIASRGNIPIIVGGSGLYVRAITDGLFEEQGKVPISLRTQLATRLANEGRDALYAELEQVDPVAAARYPDRNPRRILRALEFYYTHGTPLSKAQELFRLPPPPMRVVRLAIFPPRPQLYYRIERRTHAMWKGGLLDEVRHLLEMGYPRTLPAFETIGYTEALAVLDGHMKPNEAIERIAQRTRNYAKRQITWLRHSKPHDAIISTMGEQAVETTRAILIQYLEQSQ